MRSANALAYLLYGLPSLLLLGWYLKRRALLERRSAAARDSAHGSGLAEPPSLHPIVDPARCIGCGSCVKVCPEQPLHHILGIVGRRAETVSPADCIGHGACKTACPVEAITLVFGTERRGVEIPILTPDFETSVPGIFAAGEIGGMGLIRNALEQGRQAVEAICRRRSRGSVACDARAVPRGLPWIDDEQADAWAGGGGDRLDLVIVGAGPAGFAASLTALSKRLRTVTLEQESLGGAVFQYPRGKLVMTAPAMVPLVGKIDLGQTSKEALLEFWQEVERNTGIQVNYRERVEDIVRDGQGFIVKTTRAEYRTHSVLLAVGQRGTPRKLGVVGEGRPKVVYRLIDPEQYAGQYVLVVGGGDSALEAAATVAECGGAVVLSYRGEAFARARPANRARVLAAQRDGKLRVMLGSNVQQILAEAVALERQGRVFAVKNDAVIVCAGGVLPTDFLRRVGIEVAGKFGTA